MARTPHRPSKPGRPDPAPERSAPAAPQLNGHAAAAVVVAPAAERAGGAVGAVGAGGAGAERVAVIDIGSNSVRLAVAQRQGKGGLKLVFDTKQSTRLAQGVEGTGRMDPHAMERSVDAVARMVHAAGQHGAGKIRLVATSAVREASNAHRFVAMVKADTGLDVEVISGEEEGRLAFVGASRAIDLSKGRCAVLDVGGGSSELVLTHHGKPVQIASWTMGAVRLTERFGAHEEWTGEKFKDLKAFIDAQLERHLRNEHHAIDLTVATGGTATALGLIDALHKHPGSVDPEDRTAIGRTVQGHELKRAGVKEWLTLLRGMTLRERMAVPGMSRDRAEIAVAGVAIVHRVMKRLRCKRLVVSTGSIRDGVLYEMLGTA